MNEVKALKSIKWDGEKIGKQGMYAGLPIDLYHSNICEGPSVSSSGLRKIFSESPKHYWHSSYMNPDYDPGVESDALIIGRAVHHLLLGEPGFAAAFVEQPAEYIHPKDGKKPWSNNATVCKEWIAARHKEGKTVLTKKEVESIRGIAQAMAHEELVQAGILNGLIERSLIWKDKATGIWLKARPDAIPSASGDFADLKKTQSVIYTDLQRTIADYGYLQQAAMVREGAREVLGIEIESYTLLFVEEKAPHCVRPVILKPDDIELGHQCNLAALGIMSRCLHEKRWPGPGRDHDVAEYIDLSDWARKSIESTLEFMTGGR